MIARVESSLIVQCYHKWFSEKLNCCGSMSYLKIIGHNLLYRAGTERGLVYFVYTCLICV
jgi:hypothetical protein